MLHHWLERYNKWAEILCLFEAYLWILKQIYPLCISFFEQQARPSPRGWKEQERGLLIGSERVGWLLQPLGNISVHSSGLFLVLCSGWDKGFYNQFPKLQCGHLIPPGEDTTTELESNFILVKRPLEKIQVAFASVTPEVSGTGFVISTICWTWVGSWCKWAKTQN